MAETNNENQVEQNNEVTNPQSNNEENNEPQLTVEEQLAQMRVENAKLKKAFDKASSDTANYKKQLREKQTADEIALQEKAEREAEREEQYQKLLKENMVTKYEKNFISLGYDSDLASRAANAQFDNDTDELFKIQQSFIANRDKAKEAEWMKKQPTPPSGNNNGDTKDPFLMGFDS